MPVAFIQDPGSESRSDVEQQGCHRTRAGSTGGIRETQLERPWPYHLYPPARPLFFRVGTEELCTHLISLARRNDLLVTYRLSSTGCATITIPPPLRPGVTVSKDLIVDHLLGSLYSIERSVTKCTCLTKSDTANNPFLFINCETTLSDSDLAAYF